MITTILSVIICGAAANLPEGECREAIQGSWQSQSWREANFDWQACKDKRASLIGRVEEANCDQTESLRDITSDDLDDPYALPDDELGQYGD